MLDIARKMRGADGSGKVLVLDVGYSASKYRISLGNRATRHAYYLRPPEGMTASDFKQILDEAGGEAELEFRYYPFPEVETDLKPLLTADPYAAKYFITNGERKFLQIEGERPKAREHIAQLLDELKEEFHAESFPRIHEFVLRSFTPATEGKRDEMVLRRKDGERDELRKSEPGFHVALAEQGLAKEVDVYRPTVNESEPVLILSSNDNTSTKGHAFLAAMANYFGTPEFEKRVEESVKAAQAAPKREIPTPTSHSQFVNQAPRPQAVRLDERQLAMKVTAGIRELLPTMNLLKKREVVQSGAFVTIQFPGLLGFGKGPSDKEMKELESIYRALKGDPSFGVDWYAHYQVDAKTGELKLAPGHDPKPPKGWIAIGRHQSMD